MQKIPPKATPMAPAHARHEHSHACAACFAAHLLHHCLQRRCSLPLAGPLQAPLHYPRCCCQELPCVGGPLRLGLRRQVRQVSGRSIESQTCACHAKY